MSRELIAVLPSNEIKTANKMVAMLSVCRKSFWRADLSPLKTHPLPSAEQH